MKRQFKPEKMAQAIYTISSPESPHPSSISLSPQTAPSHAPPSSFYLPPTILPPRCPCVARLGSGPRECFSSWDQPYCFTQIYALQCLLPYGRICGREDMPVASGAVMEDRAMPFPPFDRLCKSHLPFSISLIGPAESNGAQASNSQSPWRMNKTWPTPPLPKTHIFIILFHW